MTHAVLRSLIERVKAEAATHEPRPLQEAAPATGEAIRFAPPDLFAPNLRHAPRVRLGRLFSGGNDDFLENAYRWLLGRDVDPAGRANYGGQLARGVSRLAVAAKIRLSPEGRRQRASVSGLRLPMALVAAERVLRRVGLGPLCAAALRCVDERARREVEPLVAQHAAERALQDWHAPLEQMGALVPRLDTQVAELIRRTDELARRDGELAHRDDELARRDDEMTRRIDALKAIVDPETVPKEVIDAYYLAFEDANRGTREEIFAKLSIYEKWLHSIDFTQPGLAHGIVDIGCGRGEWLSFFTEKGFNGIGVDMNPVMVEACVQRGFDARRNDGLSFLRTLRAKSISAITAFHVIEHVPFEYLYALVVEIRRVLADGGRVLFETPNPENVLVGSHTFYHDWTHRNPVTPTAISFLLKHLGFDSIDIIRSSPYPDEAKVPGNDPLTERVNGHLCGPQDYAVTAQKAAVSGARA